MVSWTHQLGPQHNGNHTFPSLDEANDHVARNKHTWKSHSVFELHPVKGADKGTEVPGVQEAKPMPTTDVKPIGQTVPEKHKAKIDAEDAKMPEPIRNVMSPGKKEEKK